MSIVWSTMFIKIQKTMVNGIMPKKIMDAFDNYSWEQPDYEDLF